MKSVNINIPGNKGYIGMDEVTDPSLLPDGVLPLIQGLNPGNGDLDGRTVGTGAAINTTAMAFKVYNQTVFRATTGKNYILGYTDGGKICYTASDWSDWDGTQYVQLSTGAALMFETTVEQGSTLITGAPHVKVAFGVMGNQEVIVSNGIDDVYTITGKLNSSGLLEATLLKSDITATTIENANYPPFFDMIYLGGRAIIHNGEIIRISAPGDDKRFYSTTEERVNGIWDDNDWVAPGAPGESSFITSKFKHIGGLECLITTNNGVYWIGLESGANGIPRLNILPVLIGAGCPTGACCMKWGTFYFLSDYNGGSWLALQKGSAGGGKGEPVDIEAQNGWGVFEVAPGIAKSLGLIQISNFELISDVIDTRQDFESVPTGQRSNVDCITNPGSIFVNAKTKVIYTVGDIILSKTSGTLNGFPTVTWDATYTATKMYDDDPNKAINDTAYTVNTNYGLLNIVATHGYSIERTPRGIKIGQLVSGKFTQLPGSIDFPMTLVGTEDNRWHSFVAKEILKNIAILYLQYPITITGASAQRAEIDIYIPIIFSDPTNISGVHIFDLRGNLSGSTSLTIRIGELYIEGVAATTATYISSIRSIANLTASTNLELGRFTTMFKKVNNANYPKVYVRGGSLSTMDTVLATTIATTNVAVGDSTVTLASVTGVQVGDHLTTAATAETFYVKSISGSTVTITGTFAYTHLIGAAITFRGSVTAGTWSDWKLLTLQQLYRGFDFRMLVKYGTSETTHASPITTHTDGKFYWQFKVVLDLDAVTGASPLIDRLCLNCVKGTLPLSNHFMAVAPDDSLILCAPQNTNSTENDISFVMNMRTNGPWKVDGQHIDSMIQKGKDFIVNAGRKMAKLWDGSYNYVGSSSTNTAILRKIRTATIKSMGFYWQKIRAYINSYISNSTLISSNAGAVVTPSPALTNMSVNTLSSLDCNASVVASDGCIYFLSPWVDITTTGKSGFNNASSVDLVKFNPATLAITRTNVDVTLVNDVTIKSFTLGISSDKNYLHIFWSGLVGNYSQKFNYKQYDVLAGTLGATVAVCADLSSSDQYYRMSAITQVNGDIYCAGLINGSSDYVRVYKSINDSVSFSLDKEITITAGTGDLLQMSINKSDNIVMAYTTTSTAVYTIENISGIWGSAIQVAALTGAASLRMASTTDTDYIFVRVLTTCYAYSLISGVWTLITSFTVNAWPIEAFATKNNTVIVLYVVGTTYTSMEFSGTNYSTAITMTTSLTVAGVCVAADPANSEVYLWVWPNVNPSLWKPYKTSIATMIGTYQVEIKCVDPNGSALVYESLDVITSPDFKPFEGTPPMRGMIKSGYVEISASGDLHMNNIETEIKTI